jgi:hypothetical protein
MNRVSRGVVAGLKAVLAHVRGEISLPVRFYDVPGPDYSEESRPEEGEGAMSDELQERSAPWTNVRTPTGLYSYAEKYTFSATQLIANL